MTSTALDDDNVIASAKRAMAPLGQYTTVWVGSTDAELAGALADGFATAQLDGFFGTYALDVDALTVTPALSNAGTSLVISYTALAQLRAKILTTSTASRYKAGSVEYDTTPLATVLNKLLDIAVANIDRLRNRGAGVTPIWTDGTVLALSADHLALAELPYRATGIPFPIAGSLGGTDSLGLF